MYVYGSCEGLGSQVSIGCAPTSSWRSRTTAGFASSLTASRMLYENGSVLNLKLHPLSLSGAESMNSWRLMIATAAKTPGLQRNSMMLASSFVPLKMTSLPQGRVSVA